MKVSQKFVKYLMFLLALFSAVFKLWAYPIFLPPQPDLMIWNTKSPKIMSAFELYRAFRFQDCLEIVTSMQKSEDINSDISWLVCELRVLSLLQLGKHQDIQQIMSHLEQTIRNPKIKLKLNLLKIVLELWSGNQDPRLSAQKIRSLVAENRLKPDLDHNLMMRLLLLQITYLWSEERLQDIKDPLNKLERLINKHFGVNHYIWLDCEVYKALYNLIEMQSPDRILTTLNSLLSDQARDSHIHRLIYFNSVQAFSSLHRGDLTRGIRLLTDVSQGLEKITSAYSPSHFNLDLHRGRLLWFANQYSEAFQLAKQKHSISNRVFGPESEITLQYRILIARCMLRLRRTTEAYDLANNALRKLFRHPHKRLQTRAHLVLTRMFMEQDRFSQAQRYLEIGSEVAKTNFFENHSIIKEFQLLNTTLKRLQNASQNHSEQLSETIQIKL